MRFEDLEAWREVCALTKEVYALARSGSFSKDLRLCSQIQAAAVSIMSNIAEGFERTGGQEKLHFYNIARASCGEVRSQLYVVEDAYPTHADKAGKLRDQAAIVGRLISGLIMSTRRRASSWEDSRS